MTECAVPEAPEPEAATTRRSTGRITFASDCLLYFAFRFGTFLSQLLSIAKTTLGCAYCPSPPRVDLPFVREA
jgi:hypothetical protein